MASILDQGETLQQRLQRVGTPQAATASPLGATRAGATPDQAKMARSPARMQSMQAQAVQQPATPPAQTLQTQQRLAQGQGAVQAQNQQQQLQTTQALAGMSQLGQQRVQAAINQRLNQLGTQAGAAQTRAIDDQRLRQSLGVTGTGSQTFQLGEETLTQEQAVTQFRDKLNAYAANPSQDKLVELETLRRAAGFQGDLTSEQGVNQLLQDTGAMTGITAAETLQDQLTVGEFTPEELGFQNFGELSQALGVPEADLQGMTVQELQRQTELAVQREQKHIEELRGRIASAPPGSAQRMVLERRLNNVLSGGANQIELNAAEAAEDIAVADKIMVGGKETTVEEILDDRNISKLVEQYLYSSPEQRDRLLPMDQFGELRQWVEANELALQDLSQELAQTQEGWQTTLDSWKNLGDLSRLGAAQGIDVKLDENLIDAVVGDPALYDPDKLITQAQLDQVSNMIKQSPIGTLMQNPANKDMIAKLDADEIAKLKNPDGTWAGEGQVKEQFQAGQELRDDTYREFAQSTHEGEYATAEDLALHKEAKPIFTTVQQQNPNWLGDNDFMGASLQTKKLFANQPSRFQQFEQLRSLQQQIPPEKRQDANTLATAMFGYNLESMERNFNQVVRQARTGNRGAVAQLDKFKKLFGGDGNPVNGFWNVAGQVTGALDGQNIDTAAQGQAVNILNQINDLRTSRYDQLKSQSRVTGSPNTAINGRDGAPIPVADLHNFVAEFQDARAGGQKLDANHFYQLVPELANRYGIDANQAIALIVDELPEGQIFKGPGDFADEQEYQQSQFPLEWEQAKAMFAVRSGAGNQVTRTDTSGATTRTNEGPSALDREMIPDKALQATAPKINQMSNSYDRFAKLTPAEQKGPQGAKALESAKIATAAARKELFKQIQANPWMKDDKRIQDQLRQFDAQDAKITKAQQQIVRR